MRLFGRQRKMAEHDPVEISEKQGIRFMHLGGHAVQSAMRLKDPWALELEYTRAMLAFLLFAPDAQDIALVGLGGGSIAKFIHRRLPDCRLTALEINPQVVAAARGYFFLPPDDDRLQVHVADGAEYVLQQSAALDVLLVDGYDARRIVEALASPHFYRACREALRPGGLAIFNLWGSDQYFDTYMQRIDVAFDQHTLILPAEKKGNIQVFAFKPPLPNVGFTHLTTQAKAWEARLGLEFPRFLERMRSVNACGEKAFQI
jgi:spermidine synthase